MLLHGDDEGLIRERSDALRSSVVGELDDPFRAAELDGSDAGDLVEEVTALSLTGGRRLVRVRGVTDSLAGAVKAAMAQPFAALLVLEGPGLPSRSRLREALERAADAAVIGCYHDTGSALAILIRRALDAEKVTATDEAVDWLAANLGADRAVTRQELAKLLLCVGSGGTVDLGTAAACCGGSTSLSTEDAWIAATLGDAESADRVLAVGLEQGATPVGVLRIGLQHVQRLHRARLAVEAGQTVSQAVAALRPPVFYRQTDGVSRAVAAWSAERLTALLAGLAHAEHGCKQSGAPAEIIVRRLLLATAQRAALG